LGEVCGSFWPVGLSTCRVLQRPGEPGKRSALAIFGARSATLARLLVRGPGQWFHPDKATTLLGPRSCVRAHLFHGLQESQSLTPQLHRPSYPVATECQVGHMVRSASFDTDDDGGACGGGPEINAAVRRGHLAHGRTIGNRRDLGASQLALDQTLTAPQTRSQRCYQLHACRRLLRFLWMS
jgi:hypothetical protein